MSGVLTDQLPGRRDEERTHRDASLQTNAHNDSLYIRYSELFINTVFLFQIIVNEYRERVQYCHFILCKHIFFLLSCEYGFLIDIIFFVGQYIVS